MKSIPARAITGELGSQTTLAQEAARNATMPWQRQPVKVFKPEEFKSIGEMKLIQMYQHTRQNVHMLGHMLMHVENIHPETVFDVSTIGTTVMATIDNTTKACPYKRHILKSGKLFKQGLEVGGEQNA